MAWSKISKLSCFYIVWFTYNVGMGSTTTKTLNLWACLHLPLTHPPPCPTVSALDYLWYCTVFGLLGLLGVLWNRFFKALGYIWAKQSKSTTGQIPLFKGERLNLHSQIDLNTKLDFGLPRAKQIGLEHGGGEPKGVWALAWWCPPPCMSMLTDPIFFGPFP